MIKIITSFILSVLFTTAAYSYSCNWSIIHGGGRLREGAFDAKVAVNPNNGNLWLVEANFNGSFSGNIKIYKKTSGGNFVFKKQYTPSIGYFFEVSKPIITGNNLYIPLKATHPSFDRSSLIVLKYNTSFGNLKSQQYPPTTPAANEFFVPAGLINYNNNIYIAGHHHNQLNHEFILLSWPVFSNQPIQNVDTYKYAPSNPVADYFSHSFIQRPIYNSSSFYLTGQVEDDNDISHAVVLAVGPNGFLKAPLIDYELDPKDGLDNKDVFLNMAFENSNTFWLNHSHNNIGTPRWRTLKGNINNPQSITLYDEFETAIGGNAYPTRLAWHDSDNRIFVGGTTGTAPSPGLEKSTVRFGRDIFNTGQFFTSLSYGGKPTTDFTLSRDIDITFGKVYSISSIYDFTNIFPAKILVHEGTCN